MVSGDDHLRNYGLAICGGGPAGIGPLVAACRGRRIDELLDAGVALIEEGTVGPGAFAGYEIGANSLGSVFLECLEGLDQPAFQGLKHCPEAAELRLRRAEYPPLPLVAAFLARLGEGVCALLREHPACDVLTGVRVKEIRETSSGVEVRALEIAGIGGMRTVSADRAVLAMGGVPVTELRETLLPGVGSLASHEGKMVHAAELIGGAMQLSNELSEAVRRSGKVAVIGGAHSGWSVAHVLLTDPRFARTDGADLEVSILHRSAIRLFYASVDEARVDGYGFDAAADVCPASGRVNRFGGLRGVAREHARASLGLLDTPSRIETVDLTSAAADMVAAVLDDAGMIVVATGYRARLPLLVTADGSQWRVGFGPTGTTVNADAELVDVNGAAHPRLLAYGLGAGFETGERIGGEASYHRRADGVWLYQFDVGRVVLDRLLAQRVFAGEEER